MTSTKQVLHALKSTGVLPVFYYPDAGIMLQVIRLSYQHGLRAFEFIHQRDVRGLRIFSWLAEQTADLPDLQLGAGTVLDAVMTNRYIEAGARFIASPFLRRDMGEACQRTDVLWIPGCSAQTDIKQAHELGATVVMTLPGNVLGPEFLRRAVIEYSTLSFIPSGGIDIAESSLKSWMHAGAVSVRLGETLFERDAVATRDTQRIENNLKKVVKVMQKLRSPGFKDSFLNINL